MCVCASYKVISKVGVLCTATEPAFSPYIVGMHEGKKNLSLFSGVEPVDTIAEPMQDHPVAVEHLSNLTLLYRFFFFF